MEHLIKEIICYLITDIQQRKGSDCEEYLKLVKMLEEVNTRLP